MSKSLIMAVALAFAAPVAAAPADDFAALQRDYWKAYLDANPLTATSLGYRDYARVIAPATLEEQDRRAAAYAALLRRLEAIPVDALPPLEQANWRILKRQLESAVTANRFGQRQLLYSTLGSYHSSLATMAEDFPFRDVEDYRAYLDRIEQVPERMAEYGALSVKAAAEGFVQPCATMGGFRDTIVRFVAADPAQSSFYEPFAGPRPAFVEAAEWSNLQARARQIITQRINPAYQQFAALYDRDIAGRCRKDDSVAALPQGRDYYAWRVREYTTTNLTPDEIHAIGLREVARIRAEMETVARNAGFASREAMIADMRTNPKWFAKTPDELMKETALVTKTIDGKLPTVVGKMPRLPYGIRPMAAATAPGDTTARYAIGSPDTGIAGYYLVNTTKLDQRPLWEIPVLSVHEAVPGHHQQIAIQQELDLPDWRKYAVFITAFIEGWGLYSERLGIDMGLYDTPQKDMGRLSYQMWRACRLVIDTGLHAKGWDKARAVAYMKDNSALTDANIDAEINRYISNPGQALAYMIGKLKIEELRTRAEQALGPKFDQRRFHDAVLGQGSVPLDALEAQIDGWIASERAR